MSNSRIGAAARRSLLAAGVLAASTLSGAASADTGSTHIVKVLTPVIEIESDGQNYTKPAIALTPIAVSANVALDAEISGRIKHFKVWLKFRSQTSTWADFPQHAHSESFALHERPKALNNDIYLSVPYGSHASYLVAYCNLQANALRHDGLSNAEIFSQDRPLEVGLLSALQYEMSGVNGRVDTSGVGGGWSALQKMTVVCRAKDPERTPEANEPTRNKPQVESASLLIIERDSLRGACSLELAGTIKTKQPNTEVKFRFESDDGQLSDIKTVTTGSVRTVQYDHEYPLSPGGTKTGKIRVRGVSENFASDWKDYEVDCGSPAQDVVTVLPPKAVAVEAHLTGQEIMHRDLACPDTAKIYGVMKGRGDVEGAATLFADGKLNKLEFYDIEDGETVVVQGEYKFDWTTTQMPQQNVKFGFRIANKAGDLVDQLEKTQNFTCRQIKTSGVAAGAAGGLATGQPKPLPAQRAPAAGRLALQAAPAFSIMAPKGTVRQGEIRLAGTQPGAVYTLRFLRRDGGGYTAVNTARLPGEMQGARASFPLAALSGGRAWRLQVCPAGAAHTSCRTSDFRIPAIGPRTGSAPSEPPQGTTVIIVPGALNQN